MEPISVLLPTRGRPQNVRQVVESARQTAAAPPNFVFYVDNDDHSADAVLDELGVVVLRGPRVVLSEMWNRCADVAPTDVRMHCGDDIVFRSVHWDRRVTETFDRFPDRIVLVHGRDGYQDHRIATHGFYHRRWTNAVGYFVPPYFSSDYNDLWWTEVADALGRRVYLPDVYTEHMHPTAGKSTWDQTHRERLARHARDGVDGLYRELSPRREEDVVKLRAAIASFDDAARIAP